MQAASAWCHARGAAMPPEFQQSGLVAHCFVLCLIEYCELEVVIIDCYDMSIVALCYIFLIAMICVMEYSMNHPQVSLFFSTSPNAKGTSLLFVSTDMEIRSVPCYLPRRNVSLMEKTGRQCLKDSTHEERNA